MANIAEGFGRATQAQFIVFLGYALGSLDETQSHLCAAYDRGYLSKTEFAKLFRDGTAIRKLTVAFIRPMILPKGGVRSQGSKTNWSNDVWEIYERVTGRKRSFNVASEFPQLVANQEGRSVACPAASL
jgi:hypothetical protein